MLKRKKKNLRERRGDSELDITSLLDILVILLVFLLKSYNASDLKINLAKKMVLPVSESRDLGGRYLIVQVNGEGELFVNNQKVSQLSEKNNTEALNILAQKLRGIKSQFAKKTTESKNKKTKVSRKIASRSDHKKADITVNLLFDGKTPYSMMNDVMKTTAENGFAHYKFIVRGNY